MSELIISDQNYVRHMDGGARGLWARELYSGPLEYSAPADFVLIPREEWPDRIADMEREKSRLSDVMQQAGIPCLNQGEIPYCHAYSLVSAMMAQRAVQGLPYVELSAGSIGGPVTGYRARGAWILDDLRVGVERGAASVQFVDHNQVSRDGWRPGADENAQQHRIEEWWDLPRTLSFDRMVTLLFSRCPVLTGHNWWGHAVLACDPVMIGKKFGARFRNSWGSDYGTDGFFVMEESRARPDESYALRSMTVS